MGYDAAKQYRAVTAELKAARKVIRAADSLSAFLPLEVVEALEEFHATPKAVLDYQPDPRQPPTRRP